MLSVTLHKKHNCNKAQLPQFQAGELGTGQTGCFFPSHRVYSEGCPGCCQEDREFAERNTAWHLAAKTMILSENIDECEHAVSDGM